MASVSGAASAATSVTLYGIVDAHYNYTTGSERSGAVYFVDEDGDRSTTPVFHAILAADGQARNGTSVAATGLPNIGTINNVSFSQSNGKKLIQKDGGLDGSRIGVRGNEDLGNGLSAIFEVETRFNLDNGSVNGIDHSYVGLKGKFGEVTIGKRANIADDLIGMDGVAKELGTSFSGVWNNNLSYRGTFGGLTVGADLTTRENAATYQTTVGVNTSGYVNAVGGLENSGVKGSPQFALGAKYNFLNGKATVAAAYQHDSFGKNAFGLGASYDFGMVTAYTRYTQSKQKINSIEIDSANTISLANQDSLDRKIKTKDWSVGADIKFTPRDTLGLAVSQASATNFARYTDFGGVHPMTTPVYAGHEAHEIKTKSTKLSMVYTHDMSKRTTLYAMLDYTRTKSKGEARIYQSLEGVSTYTGSYIVPSHTSGKATTFGVGVRHKF